MKFRLFMCAFIDFFQKRGIRFCHHRADLFVCHFIYIESAQRTNTDVLRHPHGSRAHTKIQRSWSVNGTSMRTCKDDKCKTYKISLWCT